MGISAANTNDAQALRPLVKAIPAVRSRRGPRRRRPAKLHADKAYDAAELREWVRDRGIGVRIARKGIEPSDRLGRHRWVIERTISWLTGYHRLLIPERGGVTVLDTCTETGREGLPGGMVLGPGFRTRSVWSR